MAEGNDYYRTIHFNGGVVPIGVPPLSFCVG